MGQAKQKAKRGVHANMTKFNQKEKNMISGIGSTSSYASQMMIQAMQQRKNEMFAKVDTNGNGGIDKTELASLTDKISANTGNALNVEDMFSAYNTDGDGVLSKEELNSFMKDNAPPPPSGHQMQKAMAAYSSAGGLNQASSLIDYLNQSNSTNESSSTNISSDYLEKILEALKSSVVSSATSASGQGIMLDFEV